ncbi:hypothetical protein U4I37_06495 [Stenotrophomonas maltophilia]|uniref:hypothetical protein n=1 Tax=Stenotrophomonas maltophilia TaxID=40324 RepID=UPI00255569B7|nr:hypothetical protein [Stenotrophomonas maltophilia]MDZ5785880.1 hypothetical protein [Stenotrophomonas maltophilia]
MAHIQRGVSRLAHAGATHNHTGIDMGRASLAGKPQAGAEIPVFSLRGFKPTAHDVDVIVRSSHRQRIAYCVNTAVVKAQPASITAHVDGAMQRPIAAQSASGYRDSTAAKDQSDGAAQFAVGNNQRAVVAFDSCTRSGIYATVIDRCRCAGLQGQPFRRESTILFAQIDRDTIQRHLGVLLHPDGIGIAGCHGLLDNSYVPEHHVRCAGNHDALSRAHRQFHQHPVQRRGPSARIQGVSTSRQDRPSPHPQQAA